MELTIKKPARIVGTMWKKIGSKSRNSSNISVSEIETAIENLTVDDSNDENRGSQENCALNQQFGENENFNPMSCDNPSTSPHALALKQLELNKLQREYDSTVEKLKSVNKPTKGEQNPTGIELDLQEKTLTVKGLKKDLANKEDTIEHLRSSLEFKDQELQEFQSMLKSRQNAVDKINFSVSLFQNIVKHQYNEIDQLIETVNKKTKLLNKSEALINQYMTKNETLREELIMVQETVEKNKESKNQLKLRQDQSHGNPETQQQKQPKRKHHTLNEKGNKAKRIKKDTKLNDDCQLQLNQQNHGQISTKH